MHAATCMGEVITPLLARRPQTASIRGFFWWYDERRLELIAHLQHDVDEGATIILLITYRTNFKSRPIPHAGRGVDILLHPLDDLLFSLGLSDKDAPINLELIILRRRMFVKHPAGDFKEPLIDIWSDGFKMASLPTCLSYSSTYTTAEKTHCRTLSRVARMLGVSGMVISHSFFCEAAAIAIAFVAEVIRLTPLMRVNGFHADGRLRMQAAIAD